MGNLIAHIQENCCVCIRPKKINKSNLLLDNIINDIDKLNNYEIEQIKKLLKINNNCC